MTYKLVIKDKDKVQIYGEHIGKEYRVYFKYITDLIYFSFSRRHSLESFIYQNGFEKYTYKSSNGSEINKVWEFDSDKLNKHIEWYKKPPKEYTFDAYYCGHFIKENRE